MGILELLWIFREGLDIESTPGCFKESGFLKASEDFLLSFITWGATQGWSHKEWWWVTKTLVGPLVGDLKPYGRQINMPRRELSCRVYLMGIGGRRGGKKWGGEKGKEERREAEVVSSEGRM